MEGHGGAGHGLLRHVRARYGLSTALKVSFETEALAKRIASQGRVRLGEVSRGKARNGRGRAWRTGAWCDMG